MKKALLVTFGAVCMLAGSTFASGEVTTGSTLTGSTNTGTVLTGTTTTGSTSTGNVTTGSTNTGSTNTGTVTTGSTSTGSTSTGAICVNNAAQVKNDALKAIALAFTTSTKASLDKRNATIAAAKASGKSEEEIKALVKAARQVWKDEMKAALKKANTDRKAVSKTFEQQKDSCKSKGGKKGWDYRKKISDKIENHKNSSHDDDDDKNDDHKGRGKGRD